MLNIEARNGTLYLYTLPEYKTVSRQWQRTYKTKLALDKEVGGGASPIEKPFHV